VQSGAKHRRVFQFQARAHAPQHQAAAAHISPPGEAGGKQQALAKHAQQRFKVFGGGDAAQQDHVAGVSDGGFEQPGVAVERFAVSGVGGIDGHGCDVPQPFDADARFRRQQAGAGRDHQRARQAGGRRGERGRIGELAAEIEAADEREDLAQLRRTLSQPYGEVEFRPAAEQPAGPFPSGIRGREQEDARPQNPSFRIRTGPETIIASRRVGAIMAVLLNRMKSLFCAVLLCGLGVTAANAQRYEFSVLGGYTRLNPGPLGSLATNVSYKNTDTTMSADYTYGARFTINTKGYYGHEFSYRITRATVNTMVRVQEEGSTYEKNFSGHANINDISYNFLMYMMPSQSSWRPYITAGAQAYRYGRPNIEPWESGPWTNFGPNVGAGLKLRAKNLLFRVDFRDYIEGKPYGLSPEQFGDITGVIHQLEGTVGVGFTF